MKFAGIDFNVGSTVSLRPFYLGQNLFMEFAGRSSK